MNCVRTPDRRGACLRQAEVSYLPGGDQISYRTCDVFDRYRRIDPMLIEEINYVRLQALERCVGDGFHVLRPAVKSFDGTVVRTDVESELCSDADLIPYGRQCLGEQYLICKGTIHLGRIEKRHSCVH